MISYVIRRKHWNFKRSKSWPPTLEWPCSRPHSRLPKASRLFFTAPMGLRMGIQLSFPNMADRFLFGRLSWVVADEAALKQLWSFRRAGGTMTMMCFTALNVQMLLLTFLGGMFTMLLVFWCPAAPPLSVSAGSRSVMQYIGIFIYIYI